MGIMKLNKTKEKEVFYYFLKNGEKRFMYRHRYYDATGKRKEKKKSGFKTEKQALRGLLEVKALTINSQSNKLEYEDMTVQQLMELWFEHQKRTWKPSTKTNTKTVVEKHIIPLIGNKKVSKLSRSVYIDDFINVKLDKGKSPYSVQRYHSVFRSAVNFAVEEEMLDRNRFSSVRITKDDVLDNFLEPDELQIFLDKVKEIGDITQYTLTYLLAYTGMRKGEAHALKWRDIDFDSNTIFVKGTRDHHGYRVPKTVRSMRNVEVDVKVIELLRKYKTESKKELLMFGVPLKETDFVFINLKNNVMVHDMYELEFFKKIYKSLEVDEVSIKRITPHGLRHTHISILINMNIPPTDIAQRVGNSLEMIYNVYAHHFSKKEKSTVAAFSNSLSGADSGAT